MEDELNSPELSRLLTGGQQLVKTGVELVLGFTSPKQPGGRFLLPQVARLKRWASSGISPGAGSMEDPRHEVAP